jgi:hypothetical protein
MQIAKVGESARNSKTSKRSHTHTQEGESAEYKEQGRETTGNERKGKKKGKNWIPCKNIDIRTNNKANGECRKGEK